MLATTGGCQKTPEEPAPASSTRSATTPLSIPPPPRPTAPSPGASAHAPECPSDPEPQAALPIAHVSFVSGPTLTVELTHTAKERERGLMYRTKLPEDHGMLFAMGARDEHVFWMHDTCIPLDLLFLEADGTVVGILEDVPVLNDEPRGVGRPSTHVLEVNGGWCRRHGISVGQRLLLPRAPK